MAIELATHLAPLARGGAEARAALGWVIFSGLGFATIFTLFLTPVAFWLLAGLAKPRAAEGRVVEKERAELEPVLGGTIHPLPLHGE